MGFRDTCGMKSRENALYIFFFRCWWTILLLLFCYGLYLHAMHEKKELYVDLKGKVNFLEKQLVLARDKREDLLLEIGSQSDPAWIEMLLKKHLGMVPFGQTKVYFDNE
ncbi:MAG: hypothetical protein K1000chlam3_00964 [Chlamydiae bacterium]|nr:hypothetical protein [Chlamydiota bacterium]